METRVTNMLLQLVPTYGGTNKKDKMKPPKAVSDTRGGARKGAGRKPTGQTRARRMVCLTPEADRYFQMIPRGKRSSVVSNALVNFLGRSQ